MNSTTAQQDKFAELISRVNPRDIQAIGNQLSTIDGRKRHFTQLCSHDLKFWADLSQGLSSLDDTGYEDAMLGAVLAVSVLSRRAKIDHLAGSINDSLAETPQLTESVR